MLFSFCKVCPRLGSANFVALTPPTEYKIPQYKNTNAESLCRRYCTLNSGLGRGCGWPEGQDSHWHGRVDCDGQDHQD